MNMKYDIGLKEALDRTLKRLTPLPPIDVEITRVEGLAVADKCIAAIDCPSVSSSMKDGYAVVSKDLENASDETPVKLKMTGSLFAGGQEETSVTSSTAVKIMTGAKIPRGADAVIPSEFTEEKDGEVLCFRDAGVGRNILRKGHDVKKGDPLALPGEILSPARTGLLAAGGISTVKVHPLPRIGIIAIGDEVVKPGGSLKEGQLYASNIVTLTSWLKHFRMESKISIVPDQKELILGAIESLLDDVDVIITSGGAWKSERDLTVKAFEDMGGEIVFHRVRMGPGKAVAVILLKGKTVFCLPGGPPSNEMGFLQIALPALFQLAGKPPIPFKTKTAILTKTMRGDEDWTQFYHARFFKRKDQLFVEPLQIKSRLRSQANANALIKIPEGVERLEEGEQIQIQVL